MGGEHAKRCREEETVSPGEAQERPDVRRVEWGRLEGTVLPVDGRRGRRDGRSGRRRHCKRESGRRSALGVRALRPAGVGFLL